MVENVRTKVFWIVTTLVVAVLALTLQEEPFRLGLDLRGGTRLVYRFDFEKALAEKKITPQEAQNPYQLLQNFASIVRERADPTGTLEADIRPQLPDRIVIELPFTAQLAKVEAEAKLAERLAAGQRSFAVAQDTPTDELKKFPSTGAVVRIGEEKIRYESRDGLVFLIGPKGRGYDNTPQGDHEAGETVSLLSGDPIRRAIENPGELAFYLAADAAPLPPGTDLTAEMQKAIDWVKAEPGRTFEAYNALTAEEGGASVDNLYFFPRKIMAGDDPNTPPENRLVALWWPEDPRYQFTGDDLDNVHQTVDQLGLPAVGFQMKTSRRVDFGDWTGSHVGDVMAIVLNGEVVTTATINDALRGPAQISGGAGGFTQEEVQELVQVLRSGSLRIKPILEYEEKVGASLGETYVRTGALSAVLAFVVVLVFMVAYYRKLGVFSVISMLANLVLLMGAMALLPGATLTLPGVAGIILTVGMAVDANILIYERMREEQKRGLKVIQAAKGGFDKALSTIVDANLTTLITAIILFNVGTGPVRGFATTLMLGIITSMFCALVITRVLVHFHVMKGVKELSMATLISEPDMKFMRHAPKWLTLSALLIISGVGLFIQRPDEEKLGIDFLGGMTLTIATEEPQQPDTIRELLAKIPGETGKRAQVRELTSSGDPKTGYRRFRITTKGEGEIRDPDAEASEVSSVEAEILEALAPVMQKGPVDLQIQGTTVTGRLYLDAVHPEADIASAVTEAGVRDPVVSREAEYPGAYVVYSLQGEVDPGTRATSLEERIATVLNRTPDSAGVAMVVADPVQDKGVVGAQVVGEMRDKAILAILISLFAVVMYIRVRFAEYSYGLAAVAALVHDVLITLGVMAFANEFGLVDSEINLPMVAAFLTIIGYSLNDTIVVFDRIRENRPRMKLPLEEILDKSVNQTLSRTLLTSATTLIAVVILFALNYGGGSVLEGFSFAMIIGIVVGTYSSIFVASPVLLLLERHHDKKLGRKPESPKAKEKAEPTHA